MYPLNQGYQFLAQKLKRNDIVVYATGNAISKVWLVHNNRRTNELSSYPYEEEIFLRR
jgi:hypothetical protein